MGAGADEGDEQHSDVMLLEPARQRLVETAADVLGTLSADDVPAALRAVARFTPAKRARLGAPALASVLDADDAFRGVVADRLAAGLPALADAVRDHRPTDASDPLDVAVVTYLLRPDGWQDGVRAANERYASEHAHEAAAGAQTARLREENAALRARVKELEAQRRTVEAAADERARAETDELRRRLRAQGSEVRAAQRERDEAVAARDEARSALEAATARDSAAAEVRADQVRALQARLAEVERAGENSRRSARTERDLAAARLWLLVDTVTDAAAGIRRELALPPPPAVRPADAVAAGDSADTTRELPDAAALDQVLALPHVHLIVDGYNVTKTGYGDRPLEDQRRRLVAELAPLVGRAGGHAGLEVTVAFDGAARPPSLPPTPRGVRVLFSAEDEIADDLIRRLVAAEPPGRPVCVVTSDRAVVNDVRGAGAWTASSPVLLARLAR